MSWKALLFLGTEVTGIVLFLSFLLMTYGAAVSVLQSSGVKHKDPWVRKPGSRKVWSSRGRVVTSGLLAM